jgi:pectate lyase
MFLKLFLNAMIRNIKIHNILDIIEISKSIKIDKCTLNFFNENVHLNVSYDFSKLDGSMKIKVWRS